jgi:hypothetical protein
MKTDGDRRIPPGVLELVAAIAGEHQPHAKGIGCLAERANLVPGGRRQQQSDGRERGPRNTGVHRGSAQQYQASVRCGVA